MTKNEAITEHLKHGEKFPVFVWQEGDDLVTEVDGKKHAVVPSTLTDGFATSFTNDDLTKIYNEANNLDPKRHNSITTERIFKAMRECLKTGYEKAANV